MRGLLLFGGGGGEGVCCLLFFFCLLDLYTQQEVERSKKKKVFTYSDTAGPAHPPRRRPPVSYGPLLVVTLFVPAKIEKRETLTLTLAARSVHK